LLVDSKEVKPTTVSIFFPKSLLLAQTRPKSRNTRGRQRIPNSQTSSTCATRGPETRFLLGADPGGLHPALPHRRANRHRVLVSCKASQVDSLSQCIGIALRGCGGWAWASRPQLSRVQTSPASSGVPPISPAGIPLGPRLTADAATDRRWICRCSASHSLSFPHDPKPASISASTPTSRHGEPLPSPLLCFVRLHPGQHARG
jgi:hypothetical protein